MINYLYTLIQNPHICFPDTREKKTFSCESVGLKGDASEGFVYLRHDNIEERELDKQVLVCMKVN